MRPSKISNLVALAFDLLCASLLLFVAAQIVEHTCEMANAKRFSDGVRDVRGNYNDFRAYYALGRIADSPDKARVMDPAVQKDWYCRVSTPPGADCADAMPIPYVPFFAVAWAALSKLPISISYVVWSLLGVIGFVASCAALGYARRPRSSRFAPLILPLCALASVPVLRCLVLGQCALIEAALIAAFYTCWIRRWDVPAGVCMALTTFKPHFLIFTLIPPIAQKRMRVLSSFLLTELVLAAITLAVLGWKPLADCFSAAARLGSTNWDQTWTMLTIMALYWHVSYRFMVIAGVITYLAGVATLAWCWKRGGETNWLIAATICACLLISYSQLYDAILLAVPAVITLAQAGARNIFSGRRREKLWWALFYFYPAFSWTVWLVLGRYNPMSYHSFTLILIAQTALAISLALRPPAANPGAPGGAEFPQ